MDILRLRARFKLRWGDARLNKLHDSLRPETKPKLIKKDEAPSRRLKRHHGPGSTRLVFCDQNGVFGSEKRIVLESSVLTPRVLE